MGEIRKQCVSKLMLVVPIQGPHLRGACEEHMPSMLKYHRMAYSRDEEFIMLWQGQVLSTVRNCFGVWQGAPLGMHRFCLGNVIC